MAAEDLKPHRFQPGNPGGPGRPKGARAKLGEAFLEAMMSSFNAARRTADGDETTGGMEAIERVRQDDPSTYVRVISGLLPKEMTGENGEPLFSGVTVNFVRTDKSKS